MSQDQSFNTFLSQLLRHYGIHLSHAELKNNKDDVYILSLENDLAVHLVATQKDYLNIVCFLDAGPADLPAEMLSILLATNVFSLNHPVVSVGLNEKNEVVLSTRRPLGELDSAESYRLVDMMIEKAQALRVWLKQSIDSGKNSGEDLQDSILSNYRTRV